MENKKIETKELALYFDGKKSHFGYLKNDGKLFLGLEESFGQHLEPVQKNAKFILYGVPSVVELKDLQSFAPIDLGLDELEHKFLVSLYETKDVQMYELIKMQAILSKKINARMTEVESTDELLVELGNLENGSQME